MGQQLLKRVSHRVRPFLIMNTPYVFILSPFPQPSSFLLLNLISPSVRLSLLEIKFSRCWPEAARKRLLITCSVTWAWWRHAEIPSGYLYRVWECWQRPTYIYMLFIFIFDESTPLSEAKESRSKIVFFVFCFVSSCLFLPFF